jgi:hypothetical protein
MRTHLHILTFPTTLLLALCSGNVPAAPQAGNQIQDAEMAGYLFGPAEKVPEEFNGGFSLYAAAWPLVETYPGHRFQTGLCGTWMHPQHEAGKKPADKCYTDVEGGLGWWRDTHFPTTTPKFIMGGVGPNFRWIANGPGYGAGTWEKPRGQYGVAQLSPWLLFPLDGMNLKQGTCGELFGYWYRFADQPAMLNADLTPEEREQVQKRVEKLHRAWTKDRNYLVPPDVGKLAELDPALILTPPRGMEVGYVPIATRQELAGAASRPPGR